MKTKIQSALIITPQKLAVFSEGFSNCDLSQLSGICIEFAVRGVLWLIQKLL